MVKGEAPGQQIGVVIPSFCGPVLTGTASCKEACFLGSSSYYMKKGHPKTVSPHCEWFCATLARIAGINVPNFVVVKSSTDGELWFGSEKIDGEIKDWYFQLQAGKIAIADLAAPLSRILAFDMFIGNGDRNTGNYLVIKEGDRHTMFAFDHGEAWLYNKFPLAGMLNASCATMHNMGEFKKLFPDYLVRLEMEAVLSSISSVSRDRIADIIGMHPKKWLKSAKKSEILTWWGTGKAHRRCDEILKGIQDGTLV